MVNQVVREYYEEGRRPDGLEPKIEHQRQKVEQLESELEREREELERLEERQEEYEEAEDPGLQNAIEVISRLPAANRELDNPAVVHQAQKAGLIPKELLEHPQVEPPPDDHARVTS